MSRGYVILANTSAEQKAASACAYSIRINNPNASVTMAINHINNIIKDYEEPFEYIVELPYITNDDLRANDWQLYELTPYDETIVVDCYSLVKEDHSALWDYLESYDMCYGITTKNFRNEVISRGEVNDINFVNAEMYYFKKDSELAQEVFTVARLYMSHWKEILNEFIDPQHVPIKYDPVLIHSVIINHLDMYKEVTPYHSNILEIIDMESMNHYLYHNNRIKNNWSEYLNVWSSDNVKLKIQNFAINSTIAYKNNNFVTDEIYDEHRNYFREKTNLVD